MKYFTFRRLFHSSTTKLNKRNRPKSIKTNMTRISLPEAEKISAIPKAVSNELIKAIANATNNINTYFIIQTVVIPQSQHIKELKKRKATFLKMAFYSGTNEL